MSIREALIIDDNDIEIFVSRELLSRSGLAGKITAFSTAYDGLNYLRDLLISEQNPPHFLLLDIHMPEVSGFDFLDLFQAEFPIEFIQKMRIFIISSTADLNDLERANNNPLVLGTLDKPLDTDLLAIMLNA